MLEVKVDKLTAKMEQANGAWFFIKVMASVSFSAIMIWNVMREWAK